MAGEIEITFVNGEALATAFAEVAATLPEALIGANETIINLAQAEVDRLYGERLGALWVFESRGGGAGKLAEICADGSDKRIVGYEFGTRPHFIRTSKDGRPILHFMWQNGEQWFKWVEHPGTKPHNLRDQFESTFQTTCEEEWSAALTTTLMSLEEL